MAGDAPRYDAFISYSHRADDDLAPALHAGLQRLAKPWYRRRQMRVFLDRTSMSADPALWGSIVRALDSSRGFVLLMAPASADSVWVNREIEHWVAANGTQRLLPVLTDGKLVWDAAAGRFDPERSTAAPPALVGVFAEEPRWIDLRWTEGAPGSLLTLRDPRFLDAVAEIAAPIRGLDKDELVGTDLLEHRRTVRIARAAVTLLSVLLIASLVAASIAVANARRAERRRVDAQSARLRLEATTVSVLPDTGFLLAAEAYRLRPGPTTANVLIAASQRAPDLRRYVRAHRAAIVGIAFDASERVVVSYDKAGVLLSSDATTGATLRTSRAEVNGSRVVATPAGVLVVGLSKVELRDPTTLAVRRSWTAGVTPFEGAVVLGERVVLTRIDGMVAVTSLASGTTSLAWKRVHASALYGAAAAPDGSLVTIGVDGAGDSTSWTVARVDLAADGTPTDRWRTPLRNVPQGVAVTSAGDLVAVGQGAAVLMVDAAKGAAVSKIGVSGTISAIAASASLADYLLATQRDGSVTYIQPAGGLVFPEHLHSGAATAIAWTSDGHVATGDSDGVIAVLDTGPNRLLGGRLVPENVRAVAVGAAGGGVVASLADGTLERITFDKIVSARSNTAKLGTFENVTAVADLGTSVVVGDTTGKLRVVPASGGPGFVGDTGTGAPIVSVSATAGTSGLVVSRTATGFLQSWRIEGDRLTLVRTISDAALAHALVHTTAGNDVVAYFESRSGVIVADAATGVEALRYPLAYESTVIALAPDATTVAVANGGDVEVLRATDAPRSLAAGGEVAALAFVDDGRRVLAANGSSGVRLLDVATGASAGFISDEDKPATRSFAAGATSDLVAVATSTGLRIVSFAPDDVLAAGCASFGRAFTDAEVRRFDLARDADPCGVRR